MIARAVITGAALLLTLSFTPTRASAAPWWCSFCSSGYTETENPIVLAHGLFGFDAVFGVLDYFYRIPDELREDGATVYVTAVSQANSSVVRGEELIVQLDDIRAIRGDPDLKFNLIGHSQGGLDARYVLAVRSDLVASVTTVGTPHKGSGVADFTAENLSEGLIGNLTSAFGDLLADVIALFTGAAGSSQNDVEVALAALTSAGTAAFNAAYPAGLPANSCGEGPSSVDGKRLYSWGGTSLSTNVLDTSDALLILTGLTIGEANDGLVGRCSSHFGDVLRDNYWMNHLDEVNQALGLVSPFETSPVSVFRSHANRLKNAGL